MMATDLPAIRQLGRTLTEVADTRTLIVETQLVLFYQAQRDGKLSPLGKKLRNSVERLRNSIRAYRDGG